MLDPPGAAYKNLRNQKREGQCDFAGDSRFLVGSDTGFLIGKLVMSSVYDDSQALV